MFTVSPIDNPSYIARLKTPKNNAGKIKEGQKVNVKLNDYPDHEFGVLQGNIIGINNVPDSDGVY